MGFLEVIAEPLADLLRAVADWLDESDDDEAEQPKPAPKWIANDRGGFDPA